MRKTVTKEQITTSGSGYAPLIGDMEPLPSAAERRVRDLQKERRCQPKNKLSLTVCPAFSSIPWLHSWLAALPRPRGGVMVYRDERALSSAESAMRVLSRAVAVSTKQAVKMVGGKILRISSSHRPRDLFARFRLLSTREEREVARKRVVACWSLVAAKGGFPYPQNPLVPSDTCTSILVLHTGCPQLHFLDEASAFTSPTGQLQIPELVKEWRGASERILVAAMRESHRSKRLLYLKIPPLGAFLFQDVFTCYCPKGRMVEVALRGLTEAVEDWLDKGLANHVKYIELPDFSEEQFYTPQQDFMDLCERHGVAVVCGAHDALEMPLALEDDISVAVAIAGDPSALPGNSLEYTSVEAMVANNTTFRRDAAWVYNPSLMDEASHAELSMLSVENKSSKMSASRTSSAAAGAAGASLGADSASSSRP